MSVRIHAFAVSLLLSVGGASAETSDLRIYLGNRLLGTATTERSGSGDDVSFAIHSRLDNTPLGVGDGTFDATSQLARTDSGAIVRQYLSRSASGNDIRTISILMDKGRALKTAISPDSERTEMSDPVRVPADVLDDGAAFARLVFGTACPDPFRIYDGRRVVEVATLASETSETNLTCTLSYKVVAGPGHLSPFRFKSLDITLIYAVAGRAVTGLQVMEVRAGLFAVRFVRTE